ncbi:MAG: C10 family peptidase [Bacteroidales bacterium]|nr:C10 family peptidase [Bacteroidales bacterium]
MRSFLLSLALLLAVFPAVLGGIVQKEQAQLVATNFISERIANHQVDWNLSDISIKLEAVLGDENAPSLYVFSNNGEGFIIVSAEDGLNPILGYSSAGSYPIEGKVPSFDGLIQDFVSQVQFVRSQANYISLESQAAWNHYLSQDNDSYMATTDMGPLMTCQWNQDSPYNLLCPEDAAGPGGHVYAGCVATAMSMIMYYYRYPLQGIGTHSYYASGYGTQNVNYSNTHYDWDAMLDALNGSSGQCIPAVAELQYHAGVAVNMQYSPTGSGAYSVDVPAALISHFGYSTSTQYAARSSYSATVWENMVVEQLDALKPIYYSGTDPTPVTGGGHAWVCDGYQVNGSSKLFHFNFGWGGYGDGFYTLANPNGFTTQQGMIRNIVPATNFPYGCSAHTITDANGSFEDGSSLRLDYDPNSDCTWLIDPADSVNAITLTFVLFDVDASDALYIYDGENDSAPLLATYTGTSVPPNISSTGGKMFVKFVTDGATESKGWLTEYHSTYPTYCNSTTTMTAAYGDITDGSGPNNYNNNAICKWKIQPPYAMDLTLTFTAFDLEENDQLLVYATGSSNILLATLTGNDIPEPIVSPTGAFLLMFKANGYDPAGGFEGYYTTSNVGMKEIAGISGISLSPNPAETFTTLRLLNTKALDMEISITDMTGKKHFTEMVKGSTGSLEKTIQLDGYNSGMYFLNISTVQGTTSRKFIVR